MPSKWMMMGRGLRLVLIMAAMMTGSMLGQGMVMPSSAYAQATISDIRVEGNRRVEPETVRSYLTFSEGDTYDPGAADESLQALFDTGLFSDVRIDREGSVVIVTVVENPVINQVVFEGNSEIDDETLTGEVQLKPRSVFTRARVQADVQRILDVYQKQGLFAAVVEPQIIELEQNRVDLVYEISEGPTTKVNSINFIGNSAFSDSTLREVVTTTEKSWLSFFKSTDVYDPDRLNLDRELVRQFYLKNGYADAQVVSATADLDPSGQGFFITMTVEEGQQYTVGEVTIESAIAAIDGESLRSLILTTPGEIYNAAEVDKSVEAMTLSVSEGGFAFAQVRPRADRDPVNRTINLAYGIEEGQRIYIERINIVGNIRTDDHVIRREFRLAEGDAFNRLLVSRAKKRLQDLGFFKTVDVSADPGSAGDRVILNVNVVEQSTGEISFGGGYSSAEGVIADISYKERNLMGKGQYLSVSLSGSLERQQIDLSFTEPRFLDQNLSAGFDLYHKELDFTKESGYRARKTGGGLRLGAPLGENTWLTTRYTLSRDEVFDVSATASPVVKSSEGEAFTSAVGYTVSYDTRNIRSAPTSGFYFELAQDFAGLGGDVYYIRTIGEARAYYPITDKITFVGRLIGGHIEGWNGEDVRLQDLFFKGGETIRGFARSGIGPRDIGSANKDALGGQTFYAATAEVRFPLPLIPEDLGLSGAFFADAGSLFNPNDEADTIATNLADGETIRSSVGASLIWNSPLGPLRMDYAYVISKEDFDDEQAFRFGASTKF